MFRKIIQQKIFNEFPIFYLVPLFLCSYFSLGFHHFDEHFQILEFANYKMGYSSTADLPWEFGAKIRPTLQPWITVYLWRGYVRFFEFNPFHFAFFLRFLTAVMSVIAMVGIRRTFIDPKDTESVKWYYRFSFLLWFMPFVMVRYSSETWSALFLAYGLIYIFSRPRIGNYILAGLFFACSFWFRFQIAFALFGLALWLLVYKTKDWQRIFGVLIGFIATSAVFYMLDGDFYGSAVLTPYQYYYYNIVLKVAEKFGTFGLWYYPAMVGIHLIPPISFLVVFVVIRYLKNHRSEPISWIVLFFTLPHFMISHKEFRFLFPLFVFLPYIIASQKNILLNIYSSFPKTTKVILSINCFLLLSVFKPADINVYNLKTLSHNGLKKEIIYMDSIYSKHFPPGKLMCFYNVYSRNINNPSVELIMDTIKTKPINSPYLIQRNWIKPLFLTKMEDDFEKYVYHSK